MSVASVLEREGNLRDIEDIIRPQEFAFDPYRDIPTEQWEKFIESLRKDDYISYFPLPEYRDQITLTVDGFKHILNGVIYDEFEAV